MLKTGERESLPVGQSAQYTYAWTSFEERILYCTPYAGPFSGSRLEPFAHEDYQWLYLKGEIQIRETCILMERRVMHSLL